MKKRWLLAALGIALLAPEAGRAGVCSDRVQGPRHQFEVFAGYSPDSPKVIGTAPDRQLALAGIRYGYRCWTPGPVSVYYSPAILPAMVLRVPAQTIYRLNPPFQRQVDAHAVYGFGVAPVGFTFEFGMRRIRPFLGTMGGVVASTEPIPENQPNATGLNFFFDAGGGVRWKVGTRSAVTLGYRFLHISNAGTTSFNPGVDNNVIYAGYTFWR